MYHIWTCTCMCLRMQECLSEITSICWAKEQFIKDDKNKGADSKVHREYRKVLEGWEKDNPPLKPQPFCKIQDKLSFSAFSSQNPCCILGRHLSVYKAVPVTCLKERIVGIKTTSLPQKRRISMRGVYYWLIKRHTREDI